jgi:hypothetical protein
MVHVRFEDIPNADGGDGGPPDGGDGGATTCLIAGTIYDTGAHLPGDFSKCCNPAKNPIGWTPWFVSSAKTTVGGAGTGLGELIATDLDGDGRPDIAVAYSDGVAVLLQQSDGSFLLAPALLLSNSPGGVGTRLLPDASLPDLMARNEIGISLFANLGSGNFASAATFGPGNWTDFVVGNWSRGPTPDVLGIQNLNKGLYLLPGIADGGLGDVTTSIALGFQPYQMGSGDFRKTRAQDVAIVGAGAVTIFLDNGGGKFATPFAVEAGTTPFWVRAADIDGDGRTDLIVVDNNRASLGGGPGAIIVLRGDGAGNFVPLATFQVGYGPESAAVVDLNQDGWLDVVVSSDKDHSIYVLWNQGPATWSANPDGGLSSPVRFSVGNTPRYLAVADFNGDGAMDVVVANSGDNTVEVLLNSCGVPNGG